MPKPPSSPFDQVAEQLLERLMEEHLFPLMDEMFSRIHPREPARPKRRKIRVNPARYPFEQAQERYFRKRAREADTHYETLQVSRRADRETIQAAWKSLSLRFHPDKNPGDRGAAERMVRINQAWQTLGDPKKRAAYDRTL